MNTAQIAKSRFLIQYTYLGNETIPDGLEQSEKLTKLTAFWKTLPKEAIHDTRMKVQYEDDMSISSNAIPLRKSILDS